MSEPRVVIGTDKDSILLITQEKFAEKEPKAVVINGNIDAPKEYFKKRKEVIASLQNNTHVLVDLNAESVVLLVDEENPYNFHKITGKMIVNPDLTALNINNEKVQYGKKEIINLLRPIKHLLAEKNRHEDLLKTFMNFTGKIEKTFEDSNDNQGKKVKLEQYSTNFKTYNSDGSVDEKFNNEFTLTLPLFVGFPKVSFKVELCLDPTDFGLKFFLQSLDLYEKMELEREKAINAAIEPFKDYCPVIYV